MAADGGPGSCGWSGGLGRLGRRLLGSLGRLRAGLTPPRVPPGHGVAGARCRPIGLRFTSAAAQLACKVALPLPMYRLLRAP